MRAPRRLAAASSSARGVRHRALHGIPRRVRAGGSRGRGPGLCVIPEPPAWPGSWNHFWRSCSLGHLLGQRSASQDSVAMASGPRQSARQLPLSPTGLDGAAVRPHSRSPGSRSRAEVSHFPVRRGGSFVTPRIPLPAWAGVRCRPSLLRQHGSQALSSLYVPVLWHLRRKMAWAVRLTPRERFLSFDTCGLVSIIYHNTGEATIKASKCV